MVMQLSTGQTRAHKIAAYAFFFDYARDVDFHAVGVLLAVVLGGAYGYCGALDALVGAVFACDVAELAADAEIVIDVGDDFVIEIKIAPVLHIGHGAAAEILNGAIAVIVHVRRKAVGHVFDDAETVMHHRGADLHDRRAE